jgi:NOL1/NOP2/sun family putative RNA methylase
VLPEEFLKRMQNLLGPEYGDFLAAYERPRNVGLRLNALKTDAPPNLSRFAPEPVAWAENGYRCCAPDARPGKSAWHEAGLYYLQEPSAMAPAGLLDAKPGERVLDLCAAPGGKSGQLAAAMKGEGLLVCSEINEARAKILSGNLERLGVANALVLNERPQRLERCFAGWFDKILVDAPCSGEGMFRKEEAAVADWSEETVSMCAGRQREILASAAKLLKPGGRLVYSTCTFSPEEDEGAVSGFLREHPEFTVESVAAPWFSPGRPDWIQNPAPGLERTFRLWPHRLSGEGHFAAVLRKTDGAAGNVAPQAPAVPPKELDEFCREAGAALPEGKYVLFGSRVYLAPEGLPALAGLRVLRAGLELGEARKGRFEPAHAWAMWLKTAARTENFAESSGEIRRYLAGETLPGTVPGWTLVTVDGASLGWAKCSGGVLKNHYPKALRRPV